MGDVETIRTDLEAIRQPNDTWQAFSDDNLANWL
jgi:hypothetical protein